MTDYEAQVTFYIELLSKLAALAEELQGPANDVQRDLLSELQVDLEYAEHYLKRTLIHSA